MKRNHLLLYVLIFSFAMCACNKQTNTTIIETPGDYMTMNYDATLEVIAEINENSNFGKYLLFEKVDKPVDFNTNTNLYSLNGNNQNIAYSGHYPHKNEEYRLLQFYLNTNELNFLGVEVAQSEQEARKLLDAYGFYEQNAEGPLSFYSSDRYRNLIYTKYNIRVVLSFEPSENSIKEIFINVYDPETPKVDGAY